MNSFDRVIHKMNDVLQDIWILEDNEWDYTLQLLERDTTRLDCMSPRVLARLSNVNYIFVGETDLHWFEHDIRTVIHQWVIALNAYVLTSRENVLYAGVGGQCKQQVIEFSTLFLTKAFERIIMDTKIRYDVLSDRSNGEPIH